MCKYEILETKIFHIDEVVEAYALEDAPDKFQRIDNIVIQYDRFTLQLSELCYTDFRVNKSRPKSKIFQVEVNAKSLDSDRVIACRYILKYISELSNDGKHYTTIIYRLKCIKSFFHYLADNKINFKIEKDSLKNIISIYTEYLRHRVKTLDRELKIGLSASTAHNYQLWILLFCAYMLDINKYELLDSIDEIATNTNEVVTSKKLNDEELSIQFSQYTSMFRVFSAIVLEHELFPLPFNIHKETYWLTHTGMIKHSSSDAVKKSIHFNYDQNRDATHDEVKLSNHYKQVGHRNYHIKCYAEKKLEANKQYSNPRVRLALLACHAYFIHFLFVTGENDSSAASLFFRENFTLGASDVINFKSIKWKANGRFVNYDIQHEFINDFKTFLKLRAFLLKHFNVDHKSYRYLFLNRIKGKLAKPATRGEHSAIIRRSFTKTFPYNNFNSPSKAARVTKSTWIRANYGSALSSYILQHSKKTSDKSYTSINHDEASKELTNYLHELNRKLITSKEKNTTTKIPSGNCSEPYMPNDSSEMVKSNYLKVNCEDPKSCIFCDKYKVHADELDIRKLLSIKYLIAQSEGLATSIEHFNKVYRALLASIDKILNQIKLISEEKAQLVFDIHKQVYEEEKLSDYWYRKLELLNELGIL